MWNNPNPNNRPVDPKEKDKRKFTLALVFIVVIGSSMIAFILKIRQAKNFVKEHNLNESTQIDGQKPIETPQRKVNAEGQSLAQKGGQRSKLIPANRSHRPSRKNDLPTIYKLENKLEFRGEYHKLRGQSYLEVENLKAFPEQMKDRFSSDEIVGIKNDRVYAFIKKGESTEEAMGVAYNTRTKKLGLITGTLKVRFEDNVSFQERGQWIKAPFYEKRSFEAINLSLLEGISGDSQTISLDVLSSGQSYWQSLAGIKSVEIEILEEQIIVK